MGFELRQTTHEYWHTDGENGSERRAAVPEVEEEEMSVVFQSHKEQI